MVVGTIHVVVDHGRFTNKAVRRSTNYGSVVLVIRMITTLNS